MPIPALDHVLLAVAGVVAGFVNTVAGAGSLLTLPALIFTGLDPSSANATSRLAVLSQSAIAYWTFRRSGVDPGRQGLVLSVPTCIGAAGGAFVATMLDDRALSLAIAISMGVFLVLALWGPKSRRVGSEENANRTLPAMRTEVGLAFLLMGFYAGFLQAGIGVLILLYLSIRHGTDLIVANAFKVEVVLLLTAVGIAVFLGRDTHIDLARGIVLAATMTLGGYWGARATLAKGPELVRAVLIICTAASIVKLVWDVIHG